MTIVQKKLFMRMVIILNSLMLWGVDAVGFKGEDIADILFITKRECEIFSVNLISL